MRNKSGLERTPANRKQIGGTVGGPILKNRTFFFTSFQQYRDEATSTFSTVRFPTAKMLAGDFSEYTGKLYHPDTNQAIPNNDLTSLLNPVAVKIAKSGLIPTVPKLGDRLIWEFVQPPRNNEILGKVDHDLTASQRLQGSYFQTWGETNNRGGTRAKAGCHRQRRVCREPGTKAAADARLQLCGLDGRQRKAAFG